ncbi:MAG: AEC family transporter [Verrucomicrobiota bacterium JB022]|nr:AEC family transporter [Verrucomicrobiota bacterium JB022]
MPLLLAATADYSYARILLAALPIFAVTLTAFGLRWRGLWKSEGDGPLLWLLVHVLMPCLLFRLVSGNAVLMDPLDVIWPPLVGFSLVLTGFALAWVVGGWMGLRVGAGRRTFAFAIGIFNYGYMAIPLVEALFGPTDTMGVLVVHNLGIEMALWTVGIMLVSGEFAKGFVSKLFNPPAIALILGLVANFTGLYAHIPPWLDRTLLFFGNCGIPVGLILAGGTLAEVAKAGAWKENPRTPLVGTLLRLGILPAVFLLVAVLLPPSLQDLRRVVVVQAAMPAGMIPIVLAKHYGGEPKVAVQIVVATTVGAFFTMPWWIRVGLGLIGEG